jgi:hypothetical protein
VKTQHSGSPSQYLCCCKILASHSVTSRRNENIIGTRAAIGKQPGAMTLIGDDSRKFQAALVEYAKERVSIHNTNIKISHHQTIARRIEPRYLSFILLMVILCLSYIAMQPLAQSGPKAPPCHGSKPLRVVHACSALCRYTHAYILALSFLCFHLLAQTWIGYWLASSSNHGWSAIGKIWCEMEICCGLILTSIKLLYGLYTELLYIHRTYVFIFIQRAALLALWFV